jgi:alpha-methylacyl-CoA racemase
MFQPATHKAIAAFLAGQTRQQLDRWPSARDIPLHTLST